jgi:Ig-like domain CHU_C associated/Secretion system C-terminal sorting domain
MNKNVQICAQGRYFIRLLVLFLFVALNVETFGQAATVSIPISIGTTNCNGSSSNSRVNEFTYNAATNILGNAGGLFPCSPFLRPTGLFSGGQPFSAYISSISFNPVDKNLYYLRTTYASGIPTTYIWRWNPVPGCPGTSLARLDTFRRYPGIDIAGLTFDKTGLAYWVEYTGLTAPQGFALRRINFSTNTIGAPDTFVTSNGSRIWHQNGDVELTPDGRMFYIGDNKLYALNYQNYGAPGFLTATYVDTIDHPVNTDAIALSFADGKFISHNSGSGGCAYKEINILTGDTSNISYTGTFGTTDFTSITTGLGVAKRLTNVLPTGNPLEYDVEYNIIVRNYGNWNLTNLQIFDTLANINGAGNLDQTVANRPRLTFISNGPGLVLNPSFNGTAGNANLLNGTVTMPNVPVGSDSVVIRVNCRLRNILPGFTYNNQAYATGTGYRGVSVRDVSTDGREPDLNQNSKADDVGENKPTPLTISVAPETPPCSALNTVLSLQTFGTGTGLTTTIPGTGRSKYTGSAVAPVDLESYTVTNNPNQGDNSKWVNITDRTGGVNGRMLVVNSDVSRGSLLYVDTVSITCVNLKYSFFAYVANIDSAAYKTFCGGVGGYQFPKLTFNVRELGSGRIITNVTTNDIISSGWTQYGMKFRMPATAAIGGRVILEIYNAGNGGCGNNIAIDDIQFGLCDPQPTVSATAVSFGCPGSPAVFNGTLTDTIGLDPFLTYQWQRSATGTGGWTDIAGATSVNYTIPSVVAGDAGFYRLTVSATGNTSAACRYNSPNQQLSIRVPSVAPTGAVRSRAISCPGESVTLGVVGGSLGTGAAWRWYSTSCGGTLIGTGATISVTPLVTTTYFVRAEGNCNTTTCQPVTVTINCDIDDDNDGIPDYVESFGSDAGADDDLDGILNDRDPSFPGFVDTNSDGMNDNFDKDRDGVANQYDLDSDNDGITDAVEQGGVDANGDGRIDNYTDTDSDGLSQNVDANNTGWVSSLNGLGAGDLDGDGIPNFLDTDSDNDGIPDIIEAGGVDSNNNGLVDDAVDSDGDGLRNNQDPDSNNDGIMENPTFALLRTGADGNNDGRADSYPFRNMDVDLRANPYDIDSDGDGITDVREAGFADTNSDGFSDGTKGADGWDDVVDALPTLTLRNTDTDATAPVKPDYMDIDSDNDGITDNIEGLSTLAYKLPVVVDIDNDGLDDSYDFNPAFGGNGITPNDQDNDLTPDYRDLDTDGDGQPDNIEGNDFNLNQLADDVVSLLNTDTDGDGLDNRFDNDNTGARVTSSRMGDGGITAGPVTSGTRSPVQQSNVTFTDRDWRYIPYILDCNIVIFKASLNNDIVRLDWSLICNKQIRHIEVERSTDGSNFTKIGTVKGLPVTNLSNDYSFYDNLPGVVAKVVYYRLNIISEAGIAKRSDVLPVRLKDLRKDRITVSPNPASDFVNINILAGKGGRAMVRLYNAEGRIVKDIRDQQLFTGSNSILINDLGKFSNGTYTIQVTIDGESFNQQLIIKK